MKYKKWKCRTLDVFFLPARKAGKSAVHRLLRTKWLRPKTLATGESYKPGEARRCFPCRACRPWPRSNEITTCDMVQLVAGWPVSISSASTSIRTAGPLRWSVSTHVKLFDIDRCTLALEGSVDIYPPNSLHIKNIYKEKII